jgi:hypothetical protein
MGCRIPVVKFGPRIYKMNASTLRGQELCELLEFGPIGYSGENLNHKINHEIIVVLEIIQNLFINIYKKN